MLDLKVLLAKYEAEAEAYEGGADTYASFLDGKISMLKILIKAGN